MAENENRNNVNPTITINNGGTGMPQGEGSVLPLIVEFIRQSGLNNQEIKDLLANIGSLPTTANIAELNDEVKKSLSKSITAAKNAIIKKIEELSSAPAAGAVDNSAEIANLQAALERIEKTLGDGLKASTTAERATARELKKVISRLDSFEKKLDDLIAAGITPPVGENPPKGGPVPPAGDNTPPAGDNNPPKGGPTPPAGDNQPPKGGPVPPVGDNQPPKGGPVPPVGDNNPPKGGPTPPAGDNQPPKGGPTPPAGDNQPPKGGPTPPPAKPSKPKLKKLRFVQKSLQQTKILAEAKQPWYKRLATFAIKHPVLSVVAGAGLGLGLFGATCGIAALAGGTGFLTAANMLLPSLPGVVGVGALGGGSVSLASNTLPKGQWGLFAKAGRLFGKVKKIDRKKQWVATFEKQQEAAKQAARERHRNSKGLIRKLKVHRMVSKAHKLAERTSRKVRRLYERRLVKTASKALETKNKLNAKEIKSGRTQAYAGYLQKKRKAEAKYADGKITAEELAERIADYDEDYADRDGGAPGLTKVGNAYSFDAEALETIKIADADGQNETFQKIKQDVLTRNSRETRSIETRVVPDPEYIAQLIEEEKKKGGNPDKVKELTARHKAIVDAVAAAQASAQAEGIEGFETLVDLTDEELAQIEQEQEK